MDVGAPAAVPCCPQLCDLDLWTAHRSNPCNSAATSCAWHRPTAQQALKRPAGLKVTRWRELQPAMEAVRV